MMGVAAATLLTVVSLAGMPPFDSLALAQDRPQGTAAQPAPQTGLILGRVVDGASGRPIPGAIVSLEGGPVVATGAGAALLPRAITNSNGQFVFRRLPKGSFGLTAQKAGYVDGAYGRSRPGGSSGMVELADAQRTSDVVIPMWRFAAITGTVTDEAGEPLVGVNVRAWARRYSGGRNRLFVGNSQVTDDRGIYRISALAPGEYVVGFVSREVTMPLSAAELLRNPSTDPKYLEVSRDRMTLGMTSTSLGSSANVQLGNVVRQIEGPVPPQPAAPDAPVYVYPTQFFPGTPGIAQAAALVLTSGEERGGIDFSLRPMKTSRISGATIGPEGPVAHVGLRLVPAGDEFTVEMDISATMSGAAGDFTFLGVPPGEYAIKVVRIPRLVAGSPATATMIQTGGTTIFSTTPGASQPLPPLPAPIDIRASLDEVVVTFTDRPSDLSGKVQAPAGAPPADCYVILFSVDRTAWYPQSRRILSSRPASDRAYLMRNVTPGEYFLAAVEDVEPGEWFDPEFLQRILPMTTKIAIGEGEKKVQDLKPGGGG